MFVIKSSTLCIVLYLGIVTADVKTVYNRTHQFENIKEVKIHKSLMTVLECNRLPGTQTYEKCNISHSTLDSNGKLASCEIIVNQDLYRVSVFPVTANKTIFMYVTNIREKQHYVLYTIVNFPDCKTSEARRINYESFRLVENDFRYNTDRVLNNEDGTFDILFNDYKLPENHMYRMTFDSKGNEVEEPKVLSFVPTLFGHGFFKGIPSSSDFIASESDGLGAFKVSLVKTDEQIVLKEGKGGTFDVSPNHGLIRYCLITNATIVDCEQFDHNGKSMSNIPLLALEGFKFGVGVINLANDKFLLLGDSNKNDFLVKVENNGSSISVAELSHFKSQCPQGNRMHVDIVNDRYYVTRECHIDEKLTILKEYFIDSDFH